MSQGVLDEELVKGLMQAKTKPRNFALIIKGTTVLRLIVSKKPIKPAEVAEAKKAVKGLDSIKGVCQGEGGSSIVFRVLGLLPNVNSSQFKIFLTEQTGKSFKPRLEAVTELDEVDDDEEGETETSDDSVNSSTTPPIEPTSTPPDTTTTPPEDSTTPPPKLDTQVDEFTTRMNVLKPDLDKALASGHRRCFELKLMVSEMKLFARKQDFTRAGKLLTAVALIVRRILESTTTAPPSSPSGEPEAPPEAPSTEQTEFKNRLKELLMKVVAAQKAQKSRRSIRIAEEIKLLVGEAQTLSQTHEYHKAHAMLDEVEILLERVIPETPLERINATFGSLENHNEYCGWCTLKEEAQTIRKKEVAERILQRIEAARIYIKHCEEGLNEVMYSHQGGGDVEVPITKLRLLITELYEQFTVAERAANDWMKNNVH